MLDAGQTPPAGVSEPPFSTLAHYGVAFFGGPLAVLAFAGLSARRVGKLAALRIPLGLLALGTLALMASVGYTVADSASLLGVIHEPSLAQLSRFDRLLGVVLFGVAHLLLRGAWPGPAVDPPPSPWLPGGVCVAVGQLATLAF